MRDEIFYPFSPPHLYIYRRPHILRWFANHRARSLLDEQAPVLPFERSRPFQPPLPQIRCRLTVYLLRTRQAPFRESSHKRLIVLPPLGRPPDRYGWLTGTSSCASSLIGPSREKSQPPLPSHGFYRLNPHPAGNTPRAPAPALHGAAGAMRDLREPP